MNKRGFWVSGDIDGDSVTYDVYLDAESAEPTTLICDDTPVSQCEPPAPFLADTMYFWKVVVRDGQGQETSGEIWKFSTGDFDAVDDIYADGFE